MGAGGVSLPVTVVPVKRMLEDRVARAVDPLRRLFASLSALAVATSGVFLVLLLAQFTAGRRRSAAAMRLVGVGRFDVAAATGLEAWVYASAGVLVGALLGYLLALSIGPAAARSASTSGIGLGFAPTIASAAGGGALGLVLAIAAIALPCAALALRPVLGELRAPSPAPDAAPRRGGLATGAGFAVGLAFLALGLVGQHAAQVFGGAGMAGLATIVGVAMRRPRWRPIATGVVSGAVLSAAVLTWWVRPGIVRSGDAGGFIVQSIVALAAAALLSEVIGRPLGAVVGRGWRALSQRRAGRDGHAAAVTRVGGALRRFGRTRGLLFSMGFSATFFLLASSWSLTSTLEHRVDVEVADARGGWHVTVRSGDGDPVALRALGKASGVAGIATFTSRVVTVGTSGTGAAPRATAFGMDRAYATDRPARLASRAAAYADDRAAYAAVLDDPSLTIVDPSAIVTAPSGEPLRPGDHLFVGDSFTGRSTTLTVAATLRSSVGIAPILVRADVLDALGTNPAPLDRAVLRLATGDVDGWAKSPPSSFDGSVRTFEQAAREDTAAPRQLLDVLRVFVILSAVLSVGAISAAAAEQVRRRRREFATLRAVGMRRADLRAAVIGPILVQLVDAAVIGLALGVLGASSLVRSGVIGDAGFRAPWIWLIVLATAGVGCALAAAWWPARRAAAVAPMQAVSPAD